MSLVVGIHGIAQQFSGGYQLGRSWHDSVRDGLAAAGCRAQAEALTVADLRVAFFGDLFRPAGGMAGADPPFTAADIQPGLERDLLTTWYDAAVAQDPSLGPPQGALAGRPGAQVMLERLLRSESFARLAKRAFIGNLRQVSRFLSDASVKRQVLDRVREMADNRTRVLIGHSLGSVVAYEYLCQERPQAVELLITLGSPLGIPRLVFDRLTPPPTNGAGAWPGLAARWVNIADPRDIVALRKDLAALFPDAAGGRRVSDFLVSNGEQPHAAERYLCSRETGAALGHVLG